MSPFLTTSSLSRPMTHRWSDTSRSLLGRPALTLAVLCCAAAFVLGIVPATVRSAPGDLTLGVSSLDLTAYPNASAGVHLGGTVAPTLGTLTKDAFSIQVDGTPLQIVSVEEASSGATLPVQTVLLIDES